MDVRRPAAADAAPDRRPRRYREVLETAGRMFVEKGYEATSTQDIADRLGLLKGSLYHYTESKESLLFELIDATLRGSLDNLEAAREGSGSGLDRLRELLVLHVVYLTDNLVRTSLSLHEQRSLTDEHRTTVQAVERAYFDGVVALIAAGQVDGSVRPTLDARLAAFGVLGAVNWSYRWYRPDGAMPNVRVARELADMLVAGLATELPVADLPTPPETS